MTRVEEFVRKLIGIAGGLISELSDQNAYSRYLRVRGVRHSPEEWRRFSDARLGAKYSRPKCC